MSTVSVVYHSGTGHTKMMAQAWKDKVAGAFSVSGGPSGDKFNTLVRFATLAMQQGMIWVGLGMIPNADGLNRLSFYFGAAGQPCKNPPKRVRTKSTRRRGNSWGAALRR